MAVVAIARIGRRGWFSLSIAAILLVVVVGVVWLVSFGAGVVELVAAVLGLITAVLLELHRRWPKASRSFRGRPGGRVAASVSARQSVAAPLGRAPVVLRGRDVQMSLLRRRFTRPRGRFVVLCGLGGVGKSALALHLFQWALERKGRQSWWISARTPETFTEGLVAVAEFLGGSAADAQGIRAGIGRFQDRFWELLGQARPGWLLVVDDADDIGVLGPMNGTGWIRASRRGLVMITSRVNGKQVWGRDAEILHVNPLAEHDACRMLLDLSDAGDEQQARSLARRLGGLPLALQVAGSNLGSPFSRWNSFGAYEDALGAGDIGGVIQIDGGVGVEHDPRQAIMSTFELSLDSLTDAGLPQARSLLRLLSCYAPGLPIPVNMLASDPAYTLFGRGADSDSQLGLHRVLRNLARLSLVTEHSLLAGVAPVQAVIVHPLVAETSRHHLKHSELESRRGIHQTAVELMVAALEPLRFDDSRTWPIAAALTPHIRQMLDTTSAQLDDTHLAQLLSTATQAVAVFAWSGAERVGENLAADALNLTGPLGDDHPVCLKLRTERAWAIGRHGRWDEARALLASVLEVWQLSTAVLPDSVLDTRHKLAWAIGQCDDWQAAYQRLATIAAERRQLLGYDHPDTLHTRCCLAWAAWRIGRSSEAVQAYQEVIEARRRILGEDHVETIDARHSLGEGYTLDGRHAEAESILRSVIYDRDRVLGSQHPETLDSRPRYWLGRALHGQGRRREAYAVLNDLLKAQQRALGAEHPATIATSEALNQSQPT